MLAHILGITKRGNKGIINWGRFQELQIEARGITNRGSLRDFKSGQKDYKLGQGFQIGAKKFQIGAEITNRDKRDYKSRQGFEIGAGITNRSRTVQRNTKECAAFSYKAALSNVKTNSMGNTK